MSLPQNTQIILDYISKNSRLEGGMLLAFVGPLGSGKTTLIQSLGRAMGIEEQITSPTFLIRRDYIIPQNNPYKDMFDNLIHIDLYRECDDPTLRLIEFDKLIDDPKNIICVEWFDRIQLPPRQSNLQVTCSVKGTEHLVETQ